MAIFDFMKRKKEQKRDFYPSSPSVRSALLFPAEKNPTVALAIVVENAEGGGVTAAPRAAAVLKAVFGEGNP